MPTGTKRTIGFVMMILPLILPFVGYDLTDQAPVELAAHIEEWVTAIGAIVLLYGEAKAKGPSWFNKKVQG